jgi:hypothetical protein
MAVFTYICSRFLEISGGGPAWRGTCEECNVRVFLFRVVAPHGGALVRVHSESFFISGGGPARRGTCGECNVRVFLFRVVAPHGGALVGSAM